MTAAEYVQLHPDATASEVAATVGRTKASVSGELSHLCIKGLLTRKLNQSGQWIYRVNNLPFGCGNELTLMFNQLLREVRQ